MEPRPAPSGTLNRHTRWLTEDDSPIGFILSLEGADSVISMDHLDHLHGQGVRQKHL